MLLDRDVIWKVSLVFQAVRERKGDRRDGAETDRTSLWGETIQRAPSLQVKTCAFTAFCNNVPRSIYRYDCVLSQRKADKHDIRLGGCSSWQRPEQSRWCQQVRVCFPLFLYIYIYTFLYIGCFWFSMCLDSRVAHSTHFYLSWLSFIGRLNSTSHRSNTSYELKTIWFIFLCGSLCPDMQICLCLKTFLGFLCASLL